MDTSPRVVSLLPLDPLLMVGVAPRTTALRFIQVGAGFAQFSPSEECTARRVQATPTLTLGVFKR